MRLDFFYFDIIILFWKIHFLTIIDYSFCIYESKIVIAQAHISFPLFLYKNK